MFNLFRAPENVPIEITAGIDIEATPQTVFSLLDFTSPTNALRARGWVLNEAPGEGAGCFVAHDGADPETQYHFAVDVLDPNREIGFRTTFQSPIPIGALVQSYSHYRLTPRDQGAWTTVDLMETADLVDGLNRRQRKTEEAMLLLAVYKDLARLKVHVEQGCEASTTF